MHKRIKAIETEYAGCRFRSRLEARWAKFFDALKIQWEYEPEGFETSVGRYLPDFRIQVPDDSYPYWFEVKPKGSPYDDRHRVLCVETAMPLIVARDIPRSYRDQLQGPWSALTALLWGDRGEGAVYPAGDTRPASSPAAFVGRERGMMFEGKLHPGSCCGPWDSIHKGRRFYAEERADVHVGLYVPHGDQYSGHVPTGSPDVDRAYAAARSARFEESGQ